MHFWRPLFFFLATTQNSQCHVEATLPSDRLFQGETDGSSFPNGGLRVTHSAAAFTTWDRSSPPFVAWQWQIFIKFGDGLLSCFGLDVGFGQVGSWLLNLNFWEPA